MNARYRQLLAFLLLALALIMIALARPFAVFSDETLFEPLAGAGARTASLDPSAKRSRPVVVNWSAIRPQSAQIKLNLFDDVVLTAARERVDTSTAVAGYVWVGRILGADNGHVTLAVSGEVMAGTVSIGGIETYTIRYSPGQLGQGVHLVREVDPTTYLSPTAPDYIIPQAPAQSAAETTNKAERLSCEDGSRIDLMVAYTSAARMAQGGQTAMEALINQRVSDMNTANNNSQVNIVFNLVKVMEVDYEESGSISTDLNRLVDQEDTYLNEIHGARNASKADLVALYIAEGNSGMCGKAYQMKPAADWFEAFAFGVSALDYPGTYNCNPLTLAHEFGHNMGNGHDRDNAGGPPHLPYAYGYQAPNRAFRTIMAYDCPNGGCPRINYWSNPDVQYNGQPTGIDYESNPEKAADSARAIEELAPVVANFRNTCTPPTETPSPTPTATATHDVPSPTPTATDSPPNTVTPTLVPPNSPTPSLTPTNTPGANVSATPQAETTATITPSPTLAALASPTVETILPTTLPTINPSPTIQPPVMGYQGYIPFAVR